MSLFSNVSDATYAFLRWWWQVGISEIYNYERSNRVLSIFLVLATAITVTRWWRWSTSRDKPPLPPGPRGLPILGNLPFIGTQLHRSFAKFAETYGPIMKLRLGSRLCIVLTSPSLAKEIFKDHDTIFANHDGITVGVIASYGGVDMIFSPYGDHWRMLRKLSVSEMLNYKRLEALNGLRRREVRHMVSQLYSVAGSPIDVGEQMFLTAFDIITSMLWGGGGTIEGDEGRRLTTVEVRRVMDRVVMLLGEPNISDLFPALAWLDIQGIGRRMKKAISWFDRMLDSVIDERLIRDRERVSDGEDNDGEQDKDLLEVLIGQLNLKAKGGVSAPGLTITHIKALFLDIMVAGTESTASTVEWALAELLKHPNIMKNVEEELEEVVGLNNMVEESHLPKLNYLHGVVKEVLRLHPPAPFLLPRCPSASCTVGGFMIPKGSKVIVNAWAIHRDPMVWDNPLEFLPERFLRSGSDEYDFSGKDFRYIPFGSGRRICAGIPMAERMVPYLLASILHSFRWQLPNGVEIDMSDKFGVELKKTTPLVAIPSPRLFDFTLYN